VVDPKLRADYSMQAALGVERQLPRNTTAALTYSFNRAVHLAQTVPINTPLPGSFNPSLPLSAANGIFPYGYSAGTIFEDECGGYMRQHLLMANFNTRFSSRVSLFGNYSLGYANSIPSTPTDPYDFRLDWGRASFDRRHNFMLMGNVLVPWSIHLAPFVALASGQPYDVLVGEDMFGDTLTNARAAFVSHTTCPGLVYSGDDVCSPYGTFTSNYQVTNTGSVVPRNYLNMPGLVSINMRIYHVWGFGAVKSARSTQANGMAPGPGMMGFGGRGGPPPGVMGGLMGGGSTEHPYNLTLSLNVENVFNHFNPAGYQGVITSPYFLEATSVNTSFGGGGPGGQNGSVANNRRIQLGLRFAF
jgi:hypothetical protein